MIRHIVRIAASVILSLSAAAQDADGVQGPTPDDRDQRIRDRYEQSIEANPFQAQAFDRVYESYLSYEGIDHWIERLEKAAKAESNPVTYVLLGRIYERQFKNEEALRYLDLAADAGIGDAQFDVLYGTLCYQAGRDDAAIERLTKSLEALEDTEERGRVCRLLGSLYIRKGDPEAAITAWERLTELNPNDLFVHSELAEIYEDNRMWDRAIGVYETIITTSENDPYRQCRSLRAIGRCRLEEEKHAEAITAYEEALDLVAPGNWLFEDLKNRLVAVYQDLGDLQGLADYLVARIEDAPGDIEFRDLLGETYSRMGAFEKAEVEYDAILERFPGRTSVYEKLLALYARTDREDRVLETYEKLVELYPSESDYLRRLGETHLHADRPDEAKTVWQRWIDEDRTPRRLATVADWMESYEFPADAINLYAEALDARADKTWSLRLAALHHAEGDEDAALKTWAATLERDDVTAADYAEIANVLESYGYTDDALPLLEQGLEKASDNHEIRFALARNLVRAEKYEVALPHFEQLSTIADNDYFAERGERGLLDCYLQMDLLKEKQEEWEREADENPDSAAVLARLGRLHERAGASDKALVLYERCTELEPENADHLRALAGAYRRGRDLDRAIEVFNRLIVAEPNRAGGYYREVLDLYLSADLKNDAIATARKVVEIAPGDAEARLDLAQVYQTYSMHDEALAQYRYALRIEPDEPQYHRFYGDALAAQERWGEAREAYRDMLATSREDATRVNAVRQLTSIYLRQEQLDELVREFQRRVRNTPKKLAAYEELATIHHEAGDSPRAIDQLEEGLAAVDDKSPALKSLVRAAYEAEQYEKVVQHYETLIALSGDASAYEYERLGTVYSQLGDLNKARETWARIPESEPNNPRSYTTLAKVLSREGFTEEALAARAKALELEPRNHRLRMEYAKLLAGAEQPERALEEYGRILELGETSETDEENKQEKQVKRRSRGRGAGSQAYAWRGSGRAWRGSRGQRSFRELRREVVGAMAGVANDSIGSETLIERMQDRVEKNAADFQARFDLLMTYQAANHGPDAIKLTEALLSDHPDNVEVLEEAAMVYSWQQEMEKSIGVLDRLADIQPKKRAQHLIARLNLQIRLENEEQVDTLTAEIIEEYGSDSRMLGQVISSFSNNGEQDRLTDLIPVLDRLEPKQRRNVQSQLASTLRRDGDREVSARLSRSLLFDDELIQINNRYRSSRSKIYAPKQDNSHYLRYLANDNWQYGLRQLGLMTYVENARGASMWNLAQMATDGEAREAMLDEVRSYVAAHAQSGDTSRRTNARQLGKLVVGLLCGRGEYEEAITDLDLLQSQGVDDIETLNLRAFSLHQLDRHEDVDAVYAEMKKRHPSRTRDLLEARMHVTIARQDYPAAASTIREYIQQGIPPKKAVAAINLLYSVQERDLAKELLDALLKGMRRNTDAVLLLARIHSDQNEFDEALALAQEAWKQTGHKRSSRSRSNMYYGGYYYGGGNVNLPGNPVLNDLYRYAKGAGQSRELVADFEDRLAKQPGSIRHYENLINLHKLTGERSLAIEVSEKLIAVRPNYAQGRIQLAQLFMEKGDQAKALEIYETLMERNPSTFSQIRWSIRNLYRNSGRGEDLAKLDEEMAQRATNPQQMEQLANDFQNQGEFEKAIELYEKVVKMDPSRTYTRSNLARVYVSAGRIDEALDTYVKFLNLPQLRNSGSIDAYTTNSLVAVFEVSGRLDELETILTKDFSGKGRNEIAEFIRAIIAKRQGRMDDADLMLRELLKTGKQKNHLVQELLELAQYGDSPEEILAYLEEQGAIAGHYDPQRIARMYLSFGTAEQAYEHVERMAQQYGGGYGDRQGLEMLVQAGMWEQAAKFYEKRQKTLGANSWEMRNFTTQAANAHLLGFGFNDLVERELSKPMRPETVSLIQSLLQFDPGNIDQHSAWIEPILEREPDNKDILFLVAGNLLLHGETDRSIEFTRRGLEKDPLNDMQAQQLSNTLLGLGRDNEAIDLMRTRWEERKDQSRATAYATALQTAGRWGEVVSLKASAIESTDGNERRQLQRFFAGIESNWGNTEAADTVYRATFEEEPDAGSFREYLSFLTRTQQWKKAAEFLEAHVDSPFAGQNTSRDYGYMKADALTSGFATQAKLFWQQTQFGDRWRRRNASQQSVSMVRTIGQTGAFIAAVESQIPEAGEERVVHESLANLYGAAGRHEQSLSYRRQLLESNPYDEQQLQQMFSTLRMLKRTDEIAALLSGPSIKSSMQQVVQERVQLASAYYSVDRDEEGAHVISDLTSWAKGSEAQSQIGTMLAGLKRYDTAMPHLELGVRSHNAGAQQGAMLTTVYAALGRDDEAYDMWFNHRGQTSYANIIWQIVANSSPELSERMLRQSIADRPGSANLRAPLAKLLNEKGDTDGALAVFEQSEVELSPTAQTGLTNSFAEFLVDEQLELGAVDHMSDGDRPLLRNALAQSLSVLANRKEFDRAASLWDAFPKDTPLDTSALFAIGNALADLDHPDAASRLVQATQQEDATFAQRQLASVKLAGIESFEEAFTVAAPLLVQRPGLFNQYPEIIEMVVNGGDEEAFNRLSTSFETYSPYEEHATFWSALSNHHRNPDSSTLSEFATTPRLGAVHLRTAAAVLDRAGHHTEAASFYRRLADGPHDEHTTGNARLRLVEYAVEAGDMDEAMTRYAKFLPFGDGYSTSAASAIADAINADDLPVVHSMVESLVAAEPAHLRVSDLVAFYNELAESLEVDPIAETLLSGDHERNEARRYSELIETWQFTQPLTPLDSQWNTTTDYADVRAEFESSPKTQIDPADHLGMIDLSTLFGETTSAYPGRSAARYVIGETRVESTVDQRVTLHLGGNVAASIWVNGVETQPAGTAGPYPDQSRTDVELTAGENTIIVRLTSGSNRMNSYQMNAMYMAYGGNYPSQFAFYGGGNPYMSRSGQPGARTDTLKMPPPQFGMGILDQPDTVTILENATAGN